MNSEHIGDEAGSCGGVAAPLPQCWQPIETAPLDGTMVLVSFGKKGVRAVTWDDPHADEWPIDPEKGIWCVDDDKHGPYPLRGYNDTGDKAPTHWMPLPAPPA